MFTLYLSNNKSVFNCITLYCLKDHTSLGDQTIIAGFTEASVTNTICQNDFHVSIQQLVFAIKANNADYCSTLVFVMRHEASTCVAIHCYFAHKLTNGH